MTTFATFCGSLGTTSSNASLLETLGASLLSRGATVRSFDALAEIPGLSQGESPSAVAEFRRFIEQADALIIAAPEYAGGVAGVAKNALDWLVESGSLYGKPAAVLSAGTTGGPFARAQLTRTLSWQGAHVIASLGVSTPKTQRDADGQWSETVRSNLQDVAETLLASLSDESVMRRHCTRVLSEYDIDVGRFGWAEPAQAPSGPT